MFVTLVRVLGEVKADSGEALPAVGGVERRAHDIVIDLAHSDDCPVRVFQAEIESLPDTDATISATNLV
jgi:hypothetical protein